MPRSTTRWTCRVFAAIFLGFLKKEIRKQQRKIIAEQFGGKAVIPSELELRPDAVWLRQRLPPTEKHFLEAGRRLSANPEGATNPS